MLFFVHLWPPRWVANELLEQFWYYYCLMFKFVSCSEIFRCDKYAKKRTKEQILFHSSIHCFFPKSSCGRYCYCLPADICLNSMIYSCCNKWIHTNSSANEMLQQPNLKWCPCWWTGSLNNPMLWDHIGNWLTVSLWRSDKTRLLCAGLNASAGEGSVSLFTIWRGFHKEHMRQLE